LTTISPFLSPAAQYLYTPLLNETLDSPEIGCLAVCFELGTTLAF
jgi:hypothetical protein